MHIEVARHVIEALEREARSAHPSECCGILLGKGKRIAQAIHAANVHPAPETHFEIDPQTLVDAHRAAREGGPQVLGYYHSHPVGEAEPSKTDQASASGDGRIWAITTTAQTRFWRDEPSGFVELSYRVTER